MAFFARRPPNSQGWTGDQPLGDEPVPHGAMAEGTVPPLAARALQMIGISPEDIAQKGQEIGNLLRDYTERLHRIETKLDLLISDVGEIAEELRTRQGPQLDRADRGAPGARQVRDG